MIVKIIIHTNSSRGETMIEMNSDCMSDELLFAIKNELKNKGFDVTKGNLLSDNDDELTNENILNLVKNNILIVKYRNIIAPYGEHKYDRFEGIEYYFHSSEKEHINYPHVHAKYSGEKIKINLNNLSVVGSFSNCPKMNQAVKYVKKHRSDLLDKWHNYVSKN